MGPMWQSHQSSLPSEPAVSVAQKQPAAPLVQQTFPNTPAYSRGAALHHRGKCKPCAFFGKDGAGCQNGVDCAFCHLCGAEERKRRSKEKQRKHRQKQRILEKSEKSEKSEKNEVGESQVFGS